MYQLCTANTYQVDKACTISDAIVHYNYILGLLANSITHFSTCVSLMVNRQRTQR